MPPKAPPVQRHQVARGAPYPNLPQQPPPGFPPITQQTVTSDDFPAAMVWPAGALPFTMANETPGSQTAARYYHITGLTQLRNNLYPHIPPVPYSCNGQAIRDFLAALQTVVVSNPRIIFSSKPVFGTSDAHLNREIPPLPPTRPNGPRVQPYQNVIAASHRSNLLVGKCTILWMEGRDNEAWGNSGVQRDQQRAVDEARQGGNAQEIAAAESRLQDERYYHSIDQRTSHTYCIVFVCNNFYIYDPNFPNISDIPDANGWCPAYRFHGQEQSYRLRQFRLLRGAEMVINHVKSQGTRVSNIFMGGGSSRMDRCREDTDRFIRNLVRALLNPQAGESEEDVVARVWSSAIFFSTKEVWPISLTTS